MGGGRIFSSRKPTNFRGVGFFFKGAVIKSDPRISFLLSAPAKNWGKGVRFLQSLGWGGG